MLVAISSKGNSMESMMDPRFGRAEYFIIADTDTMEFEVVENAAAVAGGGAGITSGQLMIDKDVQAVITGNIGPNAMSVLAAANIEIYSGVSASVKENVEKLNKGLLEEISKTVPPHSGING